MCSERRVEEEDQYGRTARRENWEEWEVRMTGWDGGVEMGGGDGSEMGSVMQEGKIDDLYRCNPHAGLEG